MPPPKITFSIEDLRTPDRLEMVLRQFQSALEPANVARAAIPDVSTLAMALAPSIRDALQASGSAPLNLQSLLPATGQSVLLEDTHAKRLSVYPATNYGVGTMFYETDRTVVYAVARIGGMLAWQYIAGVMYAAFSGAPVDLGTGDTGFLYVVSDHLHTTRWTGTAWVILDNDAGTFIDSAVALGVGYQKCDGTATNYLAVSGAGLVETAFTTPDETTANPGTYHMSAAAYTGTINAAVVPTFTGTSATLTGTVSQPTFTGAAATLTGTVSQPTLSMNSYTPAGTCTAVSFTIIGTKFTTNASGTAAATSFNGTTIVSGNTTCNNPNPTFAGTPATLTGTVSQPTLSMNSYTPAGTVSQPTLTMNAYIPAGTLSIAGGAPVKNMGVLRYFRR